MGIGFLVLSVFSSRLKEFKASLTRSASSGSAAPLFHTDVLCEQHAGGISSLVHLCTILGGTEVKGVRMAANMVRRKKSVKTTVKDSPTSLLENAGTGKDVARVGGMPLHYRLQQLCLNFCVQT